MPGEKGPRVLFETFFRSATGQTPFGFQARFSGELLALVNVPTGLGKTAMAVVGWLWRRFGGDGSLRDQTPRRLVYCLPMRVLVEQTRDCALDWLDATGLLAGSVEREPAKNGKPGKIRGKRTDGTPTLLIASAYMS